MADKVRLNLQLPQELYNQLEVLAEESSTTLSDVVRRSLALMQTAHLGKKRGNHLGFAKNPEKLDQEIVGF